MFCNFLLCFEVVSFLPLLPDHVAFLMCIANIFLFALHLIILTCVPLPLCINNPLLPLVLVGPLLLFMRWSCHVKSGPCSCSSSCLVSPFIIFVFVKPLICVLPRSSRLAPTASWRCVDLSTNWQKKYENKNNLRWFCRTSSRAAVCPV